MLYLDAEQAKKLTYWEMLPNDIKAEIQRTAQMGRRYCQVDNALICLEVECALQGLGYYVYHNRLTNEYEIRW